MTNSFIGNQNCLWLSKTVAREHGKQVQIEDFKVPRKESERYRRSPVKTRNMVDRKPSVYIVTSFKKLKVGRYDVSSYSSWINSLPPTSIEKDKFAV